MVQYLIYYAVQRVGANPARQKKWQNFSSLLYGYINFVFVLFLFDFQF